MIRYDKIPYAIPEANAHPLSTLSRYWTLIQVDEEDVWWWEGKNNWGDSWDNLLVGSLNDIGYWKRRLNERTPEEVYTLNLGDYERYCDVRWHKHLAQRYRKNSIPAIRALEHLHSDWRADVIHLPRKEAT